MAGGNQIATKLLLNIESNTAQLTQGLNDAKAKLNSFSANISKIGSVVGVAFSAAAVIGFGKKIFDFATEIDDIIGKIDDLGNSLNLALDAGKAKAIADTFGTDIDKVISAANAGAKQFGISFGESLDYIQKGIALAGPQTEKYLKSLESQAGAYAALGGSADSYFTIVTEGYRTSSEFEKNLKSGYNETGKAFSDLTAEMNEGQVTQQRLINSSTELNAIWASTFDGTGDLVDTLKANLYDLAVVSLKAIKKGIVDVANYFIDLYNESYLFRALVQDIVFVFKQLYEGAKLFTNLLITGFGAAGKLIAAILKGEFSSIPAIYKEALAGIVDNVGEFGTNTATNFMDAVKAVLTKEKIELIDENDVIAQGTKAGQAFATSFKKATGNLTLSTSLGSINTAQLAQPTNTKEIMNTYDGVIEKTAVVQTQMTDLDAQIGQTFSGTLVDGLNAAGGAIGGFSDSASSAFEQFFRSVLSGIKGIINNLLAVAVAGMIAGESSKGVVGLAIAAVGIAAITALFESQVNSRTSKYANGTNNAVGGLALVGERGRELVNLPSGSRVMNNFQTEQMLGNGLASIQVYGMVRGEDIYFTNKEVARRRDKSL